MAAAGKGYGKLLQTHQKHKIMNKYVFISYTELILHQKRKNKNVYTVCTTTFQFKNDY